MTLSVDWWAVAGTNGVMMEATRFFQQGLSVPFGAPTHTLSRLILDDDEVTCGRLLGALHAPTGASKQGCCFFFWEGNKTCVPIPTGKLREKVGA